MNNKKNPVQKAIIAAGGQLELAKKAGCTPQYISKLKKNGKLPAKDPDRWARATGLSKRDLFPQFFCEK